MQTKKIAAVSRDWTGCWLECLISSTAHTAVWVAQGLTLITMLRNIVASKAATEPLNTLNNKTVNVLNP